MDADETEDEAGFNEDGILRFNAPSPPQYAHVPLEVWDRVFFFLADDVADVYRYAQLPSPRPRPRPSLGFPTPYCPSLAS